MSEYDKYVFGSKWEDRQGDIWTVKADGCMYCEVGNTTEFIDDVNEEWGPLKVVEEPLAAVAGRAFTTKDIPNILAEIPVVSVFEDFTSNVPLEVINKATASSGDSFPQDAFSVYDEAFKILLGKNADYGPSNIADSPGGPLNGILVRMWDKMSRLRHLVESDATPENESLRDTLMDMANYSLIAMIVLDGNWPGMEDK